MSTRIVTRGYKNNDILRLSSRAFEFAIFNIKVCKRSVVPRIIWKEAYENYTFPCGLETVAMSRLFRIIDLI